MKSLVTLQPYNRYPADFCKSTPYDIITYTLDFIHRDTRLFMDNAEFIQKTNADTDETELFNVLTRTLERELGYDRVIFTCITAHEYMDLSAGHGILSSYPRDWKEHYEQQDFYSIDPVCCHLQRAPTFYEWNELPDLLSLSQRQEECLFGGISAGLYSGAATPLRGPEGALAGFGVACSDQVRLESYSPYAMNMFAQQFFVALAALRAKTANSPSLFTSPTGNVMS